MSSNPQTQPPETQATAKESPLTVGISSTALFDLSVSNELYQQQGLEAYRHYQISQEDTPLEPGGGYYLVEKLLNINKISDKPLVGLVGLGFKPGTSVTTEGLAEKLLKMNKLSGKEVIVYDTYEDSYNNISSGDNIATLNVATDLENLIEIADTIILCNGDPAYDYTKIPSNLNIIDPWRVL